MVQFMVLLRNDPAGHGAAILWVHTSVSPVPEVVKPPRHEHVVCRSAVS